MLTLVSIYYLNTTESTENASACAAGLAASACAAGLAGSACKPIRRPEARITYRDKLAGMLAKSNDDLVDMLVRALASSLIAVVHHPT